jgi:aminopeptidase N
MEHQTISFMGGMPEYLVAHELGHHWFGNKITCGSWEDIWLNEGFATHFTFLHYEKRYPQLTSGIRRDNITDLTTAPDGSVKVTDTTNERRIFDGRLSYLKGSQLLLMLRWKLTDSVFFKAVRNYLNDPKLAYNFAKTPDLKRHLEQTSGQNLTEFFKDWYEGQGYPSYQLQWNMAGGNYVRIKMNQTTSHPSVSFYEMPVALKFKNATQEKTIVIDHKQNGEIFFENIGFVADTVLIDPEYWILSKNNTVTKLNAASNPANTVLVYPNPVQSNISVYAANLAAGKYNIMLYDAAGRLLQQQSRTLVNSSDYTELHAAHLPAGIYTLRITAGAFKLTKKLLKR